MPSLITIKFDKVRPFSTLVSDVELIASNLIAFRALSFILASSQLDRTSPRDSMTHTLSFSSFLNGQGKERRYEERERKKLEGGYSQYAFSLPSIGK